MLAEIDEGSASGEIAQIFAEVRRLWGVPYVSAIHRHMATRPGVLEWAWEAVGPAFRDGRAQEAGARAAADLALSPLDPIPRDALGVWGVDGEGLAAVRSAVASFHHVAPINMVFAGLVKARLAGAAPGGMPRAGTSWLPPPPLPALPAMVAPEALDVAARGALLRFATITDGQPFVPGLWRMLAHWPGLLAHLATVLAPRLQSPEAAAACDRLRARIDATVPGVLAGLPAVATVRPMPDAAERAHFLTVGATYRKTSPELVVAGGLLLAALPASRPPA